MYGLKPILSKSCLHHAIAIIADYEDCTRSAIFKLFADFKLKIWITPNRIFNKPTQKTAVVNMKINDLLSNMGQRELEQSFLDRAVLETLKHYDKDLLLPSNIRDLVLKKITKTEMLQNKAMRNTLINSIRNEDDVSALAKMLGVRHAVDNRGELISMNIRKDSTKEKKLFEFFEVERKPNSDVNKHPDQQIIKPQMSLFPHQRTAVSEVEKYLDGDEHAALLHMPTGSGKTRIAVRVIADTFLRKEPTLVVWIALTEELCEQAINEFKQTWNAVGDRDVTVLRFFGSHSSKILNEIEDARDAFIIASMSKLEHVNSDQFLTTMADKVNLVVMDEAHHATAPTYKKTIEILAKKHTDTKLLGLSATPGRTLNSSEEDFHLANFFGSNKSSPKIENQNPVRYLISKGYISDPDIRIIEHSDNLTKDDQHLISQKLDIPRTILEKIGNDTRRNIKIVSLVEELVSQGEKRIIVFASSIQNSRNISMILSARNLNSYYVDSNLSNQLRSQIIQEYKTDVDKEMILCSVNILTAGFDAPKTSAVVIARPTKSLVLYSQMIGRAIRGEKVNGTKQCFIRVITDKSITEFKDIATAFEHWESAWE